MSAITWVVGMNWVEAPSLSSTTDERRCSGQSTRMTDGMTASSSTQSVICSPKAPCRRRCCQKQRLACQCRHPVCPLVCPTLRSAPAIPLQASRYQTRTRSCRLCSCRPAWTSRVQRQAPATVPALRSTPPASGQDHSQAIAAEPRLYDAAPRMVASDSAVAASLGVSAIPPL